jgi:hypothetical protein
LSSSSTDPRGITLNWGSGDEPVDPIEAGFADGVVWVDESTFSWGVELAIYSDAITRGSQIGFNIGGVSGLEDVIYTEQGEGDYAWFSWTTCDNEWGFPVWCGAGGNMLQNTFGYSTLSLAGGRLDRRDSRHRSADEPIVSIRTIRTRSTRPRRSNMACRRAVM